MFNMKNVISFPEKQSRKARKQQKQGAQSIVLSFSLVTLMMGALMVNDNMTRTGRARYVVSDNTSSSEIQNLNRAIASAHPMNPFRDIEWEKKLAERLAQDPIATRTPAAVGKTANTLEQLRFGLLAGKYRVIDQTVRAENAKVQEITYSDSDDTNDRPVFLNPEEFLKNYGRLLSVNFESFDQANKTPQSATTHEYRLLGQDHKVVGTAAFEMNDEGRFMSLKIRSAETNQP